MQRSNWILTLTLSLSLVAFSVGDAEARPSRGGQRGTRSGQVQRNQTGTAKGTSWQGTSSRTRQGGQSLNSYRSSRTNKNGQTSTTQGEQRRQRTGEGTFEHSGSQTRTGPNGNERTRSHEGRGEVNKTENGVSKSYEGTRTNPKGETSTVNRESNFSKTGEGTYERSGSQTVTGADGSERTRSHEGSGTVEKTDTGYTKSYDGTRTNPNGETVNVNKTKEVNKTEEGVTIDRTHTVTDDSGQTLRDGSSTTVKNQDGVNTTFEGSRTNKDGTNSTVNGERTRTRTENGFQGEGSRTVIGPDGTEYQRTYNNSGTYDLAPTVEKEEIEAVTGE
jgi:hypothetical protein